MQNSEELGPITSAMLALTPEEMAAHSDILGRPLKEFREDAICKECQSPFKAFAMEHPFRIGKPWVFTTICDQCSAELEAKRKQEEQRKKDFEILSKWKELCPQLYRTLEEGGSTDMERFLSETPKASEILGMKLRGRGLLLRGDSGKGKTRLMWRLMRRRFENGRSIIAYTAGAFERDCRDAAGKFKLTEWFNSLAECDCFFLDDLGKAPWSPATTSTFFDILEARSANNRPMFVTTNLSGETLLQQLKLEKDIGEPMIRRLREFCELIVL